MTELVLIAAVARNGVVGRGNSIPWSVGEEFRHFKELTMGYPCIMGRLTYESLPSAFRPLPGRENIVVTSNRHYRAEGTVVVHDFDEAVAHVRAGGATRAFIAGGASIYRAGMTVADTIELTRMHQDYEGEVTFPEIDPGEWTLEAREDCRGIDRLTGDTVAFSYLTYRRREPPCR